MANVGSGTSGYVLQGTGNGASPTYLPIGTNSGLTLHGVVIAEGTGAFQATAAGTTGQVLTGVTGSNPIWASPAVSVDLHTARYIVSPNGTTDGANYTTIASAYAAAVGATGVQTVFVQPGTYTENLTLSPNVNIVAYNADSLTPTVTIVGKLTATFTGTCSISGIRLQTNSDFFLAVTGSNATIINLIGCFLNCSNNTGISFTTSSPSAAIFSYECKGNLGTTGIGLIASSSAGQFKAYNCNITNTGNSLTASTCSAGVIVLRFCDMPFAWSMSSTGSLDAHNCNIDTTALNITAIAMAGSGTTTLVLSGIGGGTATSVTVAVGSTVQLFKCTLNTSNAAAISGAGTLVYSDLSFIGTSSSITATTQTVSTTGPSATFGSSNSGRTNTLTLTNTSNSASSAVNFQSTVAGATSADPQHTFTISGVTNFSVGLDNSDSDAFVIAASTALGTTNTMRTQTTGEINFPLQSCFLAYLASADNNVTGAGTNYTLGTNVALTKVYDQNTDFNTNGTFTAPVTGRYHMDGCGYVTGCTIAAQFAGRFNSSNRLYQRLWTRAGANFNGCASHNSYVDMDAADTCTFQITVSGEAGDTDDLLSDATAAYTTFSGKLCA